MAENVEEYIAYLCSKGFSFQEDVTGFIEVGKQYTNASDQIVIIAIEITLKIQKEFDGSFFISLLEQFNEYRVRNKIDAYRFLTIKGLACK